MNEKLRQTFEEQLTYLPAINQQALRSFDWATELVGIGKQYGLHVDQLDDLQIETMLVLVGITNPDDYPNELITRLAISPSEADKIIEQVNDRIFTPIHDYIVHGGPIMNPTTDTAIMADAGIQMANQDITPITPTNPLVRVGGEPMVQPVINTSISNTVTAPVSPLVFNPQTTPQTQPVEVPVTILPTTEPSIMTSREKLEKIYQDRKKNIDATLQSMDQSQPG